jgi:hypothetical protein
MLRHIVLVYSLACISHVFGKPHQAKNFARDSALSTMWPDAGSPNTPISPTSPTSITTTITVVTTGVAGSITVIEFPTTDPAGDVSIVTSTLTDGGNGTSPTAGGGTTTPGQVPQPTSAGSPLEIKTMTIKPGRKKTEHITVENDSNQTIYVEIILSTYYNSPGASPTTTSSTYPSAGGQPMSIASASAPWGTGTTNANGMDKRGNREWKRARTWANMAKSKPEPPN